MRFAKLFAVAVVLAIAPALSAQAPSGSAPVVSGPAGTYFSAINLPAAGPVGLTGTWSGPAGLYSFTLPAGSTITQTATGITITFGTTPAPVTPPVAAPASVLFPR